MPYTVKKTFEQVAAAGAHVIAQVKANQPTLHQRIAELCQRTAPLDQTRTADQKRRSRDEIRVVEVLLPAPPWPTPNGPITSRRSSASPATRSSASPRPACGREPARSPTSLPPSPCP